MVVDGQVVERKSDDGETGAGMVILRQLRKANMVNVIVVVTRWFGGTMLYADRFKHIQDATQIVLEEL
jgi:putative IMPACT (imprinted ancient) family translation regulator